MTLHLIKLCVGIDEVAQLAEAQARRLREASQAGRAARLYHATRNTPRRAQELLDSGSLYWVIRGRIRVRQRLVGIERAADAEGRPLCRLHLDPVLVKTAPWPHRPFQGWRYLEISDAPPDIYDTDADLPPEMADKLRELGLL